MPRGSLFDAQDASGRTINILNDEVPEQRRIPQRPSLTSTRHYTTHDPRSSTSSLNVPELMRSNSYDSHDSEPMSPLTPSNAFEPYRSRAPYAPGQDSIYPKLEQESSPRIRRPVSYVDSRGTSYEEESASAMPVTASAASVVKEDKRFPCRFADKYRCNRTFTTSGHASRHSKIHTAEKSVACSWNGCPKKFTRADNMKQHLETHNKAERGRHGSGAGTLATRPSAGSRRTSTARIPASGRIERATSTVPVSPGVHGGAWEAHVPVRPRAERGLSRMDMLTLAAVEAATMTAEGVKREP